MQLNIKALIQQKLALEPLKKLPSIISTSWIHLVGFYITIYLSTVFLTVTDIYSSHDTWTLILLRSFISSLFLLFAYGLIFLAGLYVILALLDHILFRFVKMNALKAVTIEWLVITTPFVYYAFKYKYWLWLTLSFSFLITQLFRKPKIERFIEMSNGSNSVKS